MEKGGDLIAFGLGDAVVVGQFLVDGVPDHALAFSKLTHIAYDTASR